MLLVFVIGVPRLGTDVLIRVGKPLGEKFFDRRKSIVRLHGMLAVLCMGDQ